jgi:hypothetical protein
MAIVLVDIYTQIVVRYDRVDFRKLTYEPAGKEYINTALVDTIAIVEDQVTATDYYEVAISGKTIYTNSEGVEKLVKM